MSRADDLLAVWAHDPDALDADERAEVEALVREPEAAADADAMRALIVDVRALPAATPPSTLARDIADAVDRAAASPWARLRSWLLRPAFGLGVAVATTGIVGLWIMQRPPRQDVAVTPPPPIAHANDAGSAAQPTPVAPAAVELFQDGPAVSGELADLGGFDEHALDQLSANLDDELGEENIAPTPEDGLLPEPDLGWVDELSSTDVDALDRYLETHRSPT